MSLYLGAKTEARVATKLREELPVNVVTHQGSVLSPSLFAMVVDVVTEGAREGLMNEILFADDLVLMVETMEGLSEKFNKWKSAFESKGMQRTLGSARSSVLKLQRKLLSNAPRERMTQKRTHLASDDAKTQFKICQLPLARK